MPAHDEIRVSNWRWVPRFLLLVAIASGSAIGIVAVISLAQQPTDQQSPRKTAISAFDLSQLAIPLEEIRAGGPPKDGIPALDSPKSIASASADYLQGDDRVIGFTHEGESRAYPLGVLNYHEIVNDTVGGIPIAVTYCPLCDSALVFDRREGDIVREFGVSGLLFNSNVLLYDRTGDDEGSTESLWSQLRTQGVSGPNAEKQLAVLPVELTIWSDWKERYPETTVLSRETGHRRNYDRNPYGNYFDSPRLMFPVNKNDDRLPAKARVLGVWSDAASKAFPTETVGDGQTIRDSVGGKSIVIERTEGTGSLRVVSADKGLSWGYSLWFAWFAFHPDTEVFSSDTER